MRFKLLYILFLSILITGCNNKMNLGYDNNKMPLTKLEAQSQSKDIKIIASSTNLKRGDIGFITIQAQPGVRYVIETSYNTGGKTVKVSQMRETGDDGQATFIWVVSDDTAPGTYKGTISGGGRSIDITHTVNE